MKKSILYILCVIAAGLGFSASARSVVPVVIDSISYERHGDYMVLQMNMKLKEAKMPSSRAQIVTPVIVSESGDSLELPSVGVYGRMRYINYQRNEKQSPAKAVKVFCGNDCPESLFYKQSIPWKKWMDGSEVVIKRTVYGCANCLMDAASDTITEFFVPNPQIPQVAFAPVKNQGAKIETLEGNAFIDFVVDKTDIRPDYRRNVVELDKIRATIDTVLNDKDVRITGIWLKGYASPESPYAHNADLAKGRTASLKQYVGQLYNLPESIITTDYEPEDWAGLRKAVESSNLDNKEAILALIDSPLDPDAKELKIKRQYPKDYKFMLQQFYPALRHTDYRITYEINRFDNVKKIREVMNTRPSRLSLREFHLLGSSVEPGTDEFNEIYETAVRIYPESEEANVNAANAAMKRKDFAGAERYLTRAGSSPEAVYARAALAYMRGDYDTAEKLAKEVSTMPQSQTLLYEINRIRSHSEKSPEKVTLK